MLLSRPLLSLISVASLMTLFACNGANANPNGSDLAYGSSLENTSSNSPSTPAPSSAPTPRQWETDALLFTGDGTWATEINNLENIFQKYGVTYTEVTSSQLNSMSLVEIAQFGVLVFPGGEGSTEAESLSAQTHANLRQAVQQLGVGYLGFCAGAFIAVAPKPAPGQDVSYGLGIVYGPELDYYTLENQGTDIAMTLESFPDGSTEDLLWYGGPVTPNVGVIAKYPTGDPAISEMWSGNGYVVISGPHPTADQATLDALGMTSTDGTHQDLVFKLFNAALHQTPLPTFPAAEIIEGFQT